MNGREYRHYFQLPELHPRLSEVIRRKSRQLGVAAAATSAPCETLGPSLSPKLTNESTHEVSATAVSSAPASQPDELPATPPSAAHITSQVIDEKSRSSNPRSAPQRTEPTETKGNQQPEQAGMPVRISVHVLGQYAFCPRAGVLASEASDESEPEDEPIRLSYLPNFDIALIEEKIVERFWQWLLSGLALAITVATAITSAPVGPPWLMQSACVLAIVFFKCSMDKSLDLAILIYRRHQALHAKRVAPLESISENTTVNWWSLLKSGFESNSYQEPMRHPELPIEGNPWRVLHYGSLRIPVIRSGVNHLGRRKGDLFPKHQLRLVAYALLLTAADHIRTPYAIIFPANSTTGMAIPITPQLRDRARHFILYVSHLQQQSQARQVVPDVPNNRALCGGCLYGKPESINVRQIRAANKLGANLLVLTDRRGRYFHCPCGDRFKSAPPHRTVLRRQLTAIIQ